MSGGTICRAHGREHWKVTDRHQRTSAFDGYVTMDSDWSAVRCFAPVTDAAGTTHFCGLGWRTKAAYVETLPDAPNEWWLQ